jgi:hypothetical protein
LSLPRLTSQRFVSNSRKFLKIISCRTGTAQHGSMHRLCMLEDCIRVPRCKCSRDSCRRPGPQDWKARLADPQGTGLYGGRQLDSDRRHLAFAPRNRLRVHLCGAESLGRNCQGAWVQGKTIPYCSYWICRRRKFLLECGDIHLECPHNHDWTSLSCAADCWRDGRDSCFFWLSFRGSDCSRVIPDLRKDLDRLCRHGKIQVNLCNCVGSGLVGSWKFLFNQGKHPGAGEWWEQGHRNGCPADWKHWLHCSCRRCADCCCQRPWWIHSCAQWWQPFGVPLEGWTAHQRVHRTEKRWKKWNYFDKSLFFQK